MKVNDWGNNYQENKHTSRLVVRLQEDWEYKKKKNLSSEFSKHW